ncbi:hypothetical protein DP091_09920 [Paenibacillus sp. MDMC362]|nr:hypothetical protein DP091_09920 [Paenibacillus sp. MDMC362]
MRLQPTVSGIVLSNFLIIYTFGAGMNQHAVGRGFLFHMGQGIWYDRITMAAVYWTIRSMEHHIE